MHLLNALPQRLDPGATPTFAGLISATLTSPASSPLTLGTGSFGTALTVASATGDVSISSTTAASSNAGALIVAGGISAGNTGSAASYFGGSVTATGTLRATNGNLYTYGESGNATDGILFFNSAANNYIYGSGSQLAIYTAGVQRATISSTGATFAGAVSAQRLEAVDAAANNRSAAFFRTQNNTTYSSPVLSIQGDRTTTDASYNLIYATNGNVTGVFAVRDSGNAVNTNNSYGSISDRKLKENIVDATSKLEKLNQVRIVNFNRIGNKQKQLGVIAQELEQIFPSMIEEVIDRDAEGNDLGTTTKSVKYSVFVPMLIKAIQELTARLAAVEAK